MNIEFPCKPGDDIWLVDNDTMEVYCEKGGISGVVVYKDGFAILDSIGELRELHSQCGCLTREEAEAFRDKLLNAKYKPSVARLISVGMNEWYCEFGKCSVCGTENPMDAKYCLRCGVKLQATAYQTACTMCGGDIMSDFACCPKCGAKINCSDSASK